MHWLTRLLGRRQPVSRQLRYAFRPSLDALEDRCVPTVSSIVSNFNGTAIPAGDSLWFSSVFKAKGLPAAPVTLHVTDQTVTFAGNTVNVPDSVITLSPSTTTATATFDTGSNSWIINLPSSYSGNAFLGGAAFDVAARLPGGINPVTWSGNFTTDTAGVSLNWQWAAAVYTQFGSEDALNVKPLDGSGSVTVYHNSDHAGTPEAFKSFVVGGARGGGGSNFSGSYSATKTVIPETATVCSATASLSGQVTVPDQALAFGWTVTLMGTDHEGHSVLLTFTGNNSGSYSFNGLEAGSYSLSITFEDNTLLIGQSVGTVDGIPDGTPGDMSIVGILLTACDSTGIHYDFTGIVNAGS